MSKTSSDTTSDTTETLRVDGVSVEASCSASVLELVLDRLRALGSDRARAGRALVFLVGPPGSGKTTFAQLLASAAQRRTAGHVAVVSMDGFHYPAAHLASHRVAGTSRALTSIKGHPDTFDVEALARRLRELKQNDVTWPVYDRTVHDVRPGAVVTAPLVIVEGNYLLLDEPGWSDLRGLADLTVFLDAARDLLRERLIARKVRGGLAPAEAESFYERSDRHNVDLVLDGTGREHADIVLTVTSEGTIEHGGTA